MSIDSVRAANFCRTPAWASAGWPRWTCSSATALAADRSAGPEAPHFAADREERDLAVHAGRPEPGGHLRSEAAAGEAARPASAGELRRRRFPERQIPRHRNPRLEADLQAVRPIGHRSLRPVPAYLAVRGRSGHHPLLLSRGLHALAGAVPDQQRLAAHRPAEPGVVDPVRARDARIRICRASWCCSRAASGRVRRSTARAFCPPPTRARRSARDAIRF